MEFRRLQRERILDRIEVHAITRIHLRLICNYADFNKFMDTFMDERWLAWNFSLTEVRI